MTDMLSVISFICMSCLHLLSGYRMAAECAQSALLERVMDNKEDAGSDCLYYVKVSHFCSFTLVQIVAFHVTLIQHVISLYKKIRIYNISAYRVTCGIRHK